MLSLQGQIKVKIAVFKDRYNIFQGVCFHKFSPYAGSTVKSRGINLKKTFQDSKVFFFFPGSCEQFGMFPHQVKPLFGSFFLHIFIEKPGVTKNSPADHDPVNTILFSFLQAIFKRRNIAISMDQCVRSHTIPELHSPGNLIPIGSALGLLLLNAAMNGN